MQTFLPFPDFDRTACTLDRQRLGKQRIEAWQILQTLLGASRGWANHPAVKMWAGYEDTLREYGISICREWLARGYNDSMLGRFESLTLPKSWRPWWLGDERLHSSHRSALVAKMPEHYAERFPGAESIINYWWPV